MESMNKILCLVGLTLGQFFFERIKFNKNSILYKLVSKIFLFYYGRYTDCLSLPYATNKSKTEKEKRSITFKKNRKKETFRVNIKS